MSGEERKQIPAAATEQGLNWMAGICVPCFFFFSCLPAEDICVFTISWRKPEAWCSLRVGVRQSKRHSKFACESVCLLRVEQMKCFEQKRTIAWEGIQRQLVREFHSLKKIKKKSPHCLSGFNFVILQYFGTFWLFFFFFFLICPPSVFPAFMYCFGCILASGWASSAGTGSLCSGRTGCSTRSQEKSPVPLPKPWSMKLKATLARKTQISRLRTWILHTKTLK